MNIPFDKLNKVHHQKFILNFVLANKKFAVNSLDEIHFLLTFYIHKCTFWEIYFSSTILILENLEFKDTYIHFKYHDLEFNLVFCLHALIIELFIMLNLNMSVLAGHHVMLKIEIWFLVMTFYTQLVWNYLNATLNFLRVYILFLIVYKWI